MYIKKFKDFLILEEDGGGSAGGDGGGSGYATLGSMNGMGDIVAAQPGSVPGAVWGPGSGTIGSGDIGQVLGVYTKYPAFVAQQKLVNKKNIKRRKKSKKKKED